jgi:7tm Chemosensory receptor
MFAFKVLWWLNHLFGMLPVRFQIGTGLIVSNKFHVVYSFCVALLMTVSYPITIYYKLILVNDFNVEVVVKWSIVLDYFLYYTSMVACLFTSASNMSSYKQILKSLQQSHQCLEKFGPVAVDLRLVPKYVYLKSTVLICYLMNLVYGSGSVAIWCVTLVSDSVIICAVGNMLMVLGCLTAYMKCLNVKIAKFLEEKRPHRYMQICEELEAVMILYGEMVEAGHQFKKKISMQMLCLLLGEFMLTFIEVSFER